MEQRVVYRDRNVLPLPPKATEILLLLLENAGDVVTRETIRQKLWGDSFVEEANISRNLSVLRSTLREHMGDVDPIKTVYKRGYQYIGPVDIAPVVVPETESGKRPAFRPLDKPASAQGPSESEDAKSENAETERSPQAAQPAVEAAPPLPTPPLSAPRRQSFFAGVVAGGALLLLAVAAGLAVWHWKRSHAREVQASTRRSLAILTFRNLSNQSDDDWLGTALQETLSADLNNNDRVVLVSVDQTDRAARDLALAPMRVFDNQTLQNIGRRLNCDLAVVGSYLPEGDQVRVDLQLRSTATGAVVANFSQITDKHRLLPAMAAADADLRKAMGLPPVPSSQGNSLPASGDSEDGLKDYAEGVRLMREDRYSEAQPFLSRAVLASPASPLAHIALATVWDAIGYEDRAEAEVHMALNTASSLAPEPQLVLRSGGYWILNDWPNAIDGYTRLHRMHPDDLDYALYLANSQSKSGDPKSALATVQAQVASLPASANDPRLEDSRARAFQALGDWRALLLSSGREISLAHAMSWKYREADGYEWEGFAWSALGDHVHAEADFQRAQQLNEELNDNESVAYDLGLLSDEQSNVGDPQAAETLLHSSQIYEKLNLRFGMIQSYLRFGNSLVNANNFSAAATYYKKAVDLAREIHNKNSEDDNLNNLALVENALGDFDQAEIYANQALALGRSISSTGQVESALLMLSDTDDNRGNLASAEQLTRQALDVATKTSDNGMIAVCLARIGRYQTLAGNLDAARKLFDQAESMHILTGDGLAEERESVAEWMIASGQPAAVEAPMMEAVKSAASDDLRGEAWYFLGESYLTRGDLPNARLAVQNALHLSSKTENLFNDLLPDSILAARIDAAGGNPAQAAAELTPLLQTAHRLKTSENEFDIRLAIGEVQLQRGQRSEGQRTLQSLIAEASRHGYVLTAQKARKALLDHQLPA